MTSLVTAFAYNQVVTAVYVQTSEYDISNRWNVPMLQNNIALYKNSSQTVLLEVRSLSNKLLKITNIDFYLNIINPRTNELLFRRVGTVLDQDKGRISFILSATDTDNMEAGAYLFSISAIDNDGVETFLFLDQNADATGDVILYDKALPAFIPSFQVTEFGSQLYNETAYFISSAFPGDGQFSNTNGQHTVAAYMTNFTGKFYIEASLMLDPGQFDWFDIVITEQFCYQVYNGFSGIECFNFFGPVNWVRFKYLPDAMNEGTFDQIYYRAVNQPNPNYVVKTTCTT